MQAFSVADGSIAPLRKLISPCRPNEDPSLSGSIAGLVCSWFRSIHVPMSGMAWQNNSGNWDLHWSIRMPKIPVHCHMWLSAPTPYGGPTASQFPLLRSRQSFVLRDLYKTSFLEMNQLLKTFEKDFPKHYPLMLTLARTGMRLGEALGLKWEDINFQNRFLNIQRNIVKGRIETPKSGKSRKVDMSLLFCL